MSVELSAGGYPLHVVSGGLVAPGSPILCSPPLHCRKTLERIQACHHVVTLLCAIIEVEVEIGNHNVWSLLRKMFDNHSAKNSFS